MNSFSSASRLLLDVPRVVFREIKGFLKLGCSLQERLHPQRVGSSPPPPPLSVVSSDHAAIIAQRTCLYAHENNIIEMPDASS
mmetsp:Transcript_10881/g.35798  ORF Transcript_10881/g.35798 Transcript_10881/m.35798 type:complete len:83 (+) Transcript_10881:416-664(+)